MTVSFGDFKKLDLRVGRITGVERVEGSEKLLKLAVDIGTETREVIAGIGRAYDTDALMRSFVVIVVNLEPKTIMGLASEGMLLAADVNGSPILIRPDRDTPPGSAVR